MLVSTNADGRVCGTCPEAVPGHDGIPADFDVNYMTDWLYHDGTFTYDPQEHPIVVYQDDILEMMMDQEYRICVLELGIGGAEA